MNDRTRQAARDTGAGCGAVAAVVAAILLIAAIGAGLWWLGVFSSGTAGTGNLHKDQQSSQNRERWSATYNNDMQQVQADQTNLATLHAAATGTGATQQDRQNYIGAQLICRTDVAAYNTDAANVLGAQWLPAGFATSLDSTDYCGK